MESSSLSKIIILKHESGSKILEKTPGSIMELFKEMRFHFPDISNLECTYISSDKTEK